MRDPCSGKFRSSASSSESREAKRARRRRSMENDPDIVLAMGGNSDSEIDQVKERENLETFLRKEGPWKDHKITLNHLLGAIKKVHEVNSGKKLPVFPFYRDQDTMSMDDLLYDVSLFLTYWEVYNFEIAVNLQGLLRLTFPYYEKYEDEKEDANLIFPGLPPYEKLAEEFGGRSSDIVSPQAQMKQADINQLEVALHATRDDKLRSNLQELIDTAKQSLEDLKTISSLHWESPTLLQMLRTSPFAKQADTIKKYVRNEDPRHVCVAHALEFGAPDWGKAPTIQKPQKTYVPDEMLPDTTDKVEHRKEIEELEKKRKKKEEEEAQTAASKRQEEEREKYIKQLVTRFTPFPSKSYYIESNHRDVDHLVIQWCKQEFLWSNNKAEELQKKVYQDETQIGRGVNAIKKIVHMLQGKNVTLLGQVNYQSDETRRFFGYRSIQSVLKGTCKKPYHSDIKIHLPWGGKLRHGELSLSDLCDMSEVQLNNVLCTAPALL